ncbi:MAG: GntR family transcriptional regulator [Gemmatimonadales bacterium]
MFEHIDPHSPTPLYEQIAARIRVAVAAGELGPGLALPSVRQLAQRLRVNPATVVQAYKALESDGFVDMRHGAGTFIKAVAGERRSQERHEQARLLVRELLASAARLGVSPDDLRHALKDELGAAA